jgi:hypothetical protein
VSATDVRAAAAKAGKTPQENDRYTGMKNIIMKATLHKEHLTILHIIFVPRKSNLEEGLEGQSPKAYSSTTFGKVWMGEAEKLTAAQLLRR